MSADQLNQLRIDAKFNTKQLEPKEKYDQLKTTYKTAREEALAKSTDVNSTPEEREEAIRVANAADRVLDRLRTGDMDYIDNVYMSHYITNTIDGVGKAYEYSSIDKKAVADPFYLASYNGSITRANQDNAAENSYNQSLVNAEFAGQIVLETVQVGTDASGQPIYSQQPKRNPDGTLMFNKNYLDSRYKKSNGRITDNTEINVGGVMQKVSDIKKLLLNSKNNAVKNNIYKGIIAVTPELYQSQLKAGQTLEDDFQVVGNNVVFQTDGTFIDDEVIIPIESILAVIQNAGDDNGTPNGRDYNTEYQALAPGESITLDNGDVWTKPTQ